MNLVNILQRLSAYTSKKSGAVIREAGPTAAQNAPVASKAHVIVCDGGEWREEAHRSTPAGAPPAVAGAETGAGMLRRIAAYATNKIGLANTIAGQRSGLTDLKKKVWDRDQTLRALQEENRILKSDLARLGNWLVENGHASVDQITASPFKAFEHAVGVAVAHESRRIGIPAAALRTRRAPGANERPAVPGSPGFASISAEYWKERNFS